MKLLSSIMTRLYKVVLRMRYKRLRKVTRISIEAVLAAEYPEDEDEECHWYIRPTGTIWELVLSTL